MNSNDYAVVVGINRYPEFKPLQACEADAEKFATWLRSPAGGALPAKNIKRILGSKFGIAASRETAKPTCELVERALGRFVDKARETDARVGRRLYLYLTGHGIAPDTQDAALLMANAASGFMGYHIPGSGYLEWFRKAGIFEELVLLMDCCRDSSDTAPCRPPPWDPIEPVARTRAFVAGLATQWSRVAREEPFGNDVQGLFTKALIAGLGSAANEKNEVTGSELSGYVYKYLHELKGDDVQEPDFIVNINRDIVFCTLADPEQFVVNVTLTSPIAVDQLEIQNSTFTVVKKSPAAETNWQVTLRPGLYQVLDSVSQKKQTFRVVGAKATEVSM